ncbi:hypothetical protein BCR33DRAFT_738666 [Rhizoclosmatium globosum]|uniref:Uncharacterized protein n=1 Tax=Rhizoclosmatium globosum TaxID=329046 RepID=A0A1Y2CAN5_9FUNG|nr:hypothetical protein BCR33DRAFT_738666 [Rhizoclosmatium globosum]|eukprot:ORY43395.1 hypothetical protein BCR33DRAFT_738666 [Rhizoclosmatium globosum]
MDFRFYSSQGYGKRVAGSNEKLKNEEMAKSIVTPPFEVATQAGVIERRSNFVYVLTYDSLSVQNKSNYAFNCVAMYANQEVKGKLAMSPNHSTDPLPPLSFNHLLNTAIKIKAKTYLQTKWDS